MAIIIGKTHQRGRQQDLPDRLAHQRCNHPVSQEELPRRPSLQHQKSHLILHPDQDPVQGARLVPEVQEVEAEEGEGDKKIM